MVGRSQVAPFRAFMVICITAMIVVLFEEGFWLLMGSMALGRGPIPHAYLANLLFFISVLISACLFWKWPWVAMLVAWIDLGTILLHINPWNNGSSTTFFHEFMYDHIFFLAANLGFIAFVLMRRKGGALG